MSAAGEYHSQNERAGRRLQFSLLTLLLFMTVFCVALFWWVRPRPVEIVALLHVRPPSSNLTGGRSTVRQWEIIQRTQLAFLKSVGVLHAALSDPQVAKLPLVTSQAEPVAWLKGELHVEFQQNSEILIIGLTSPSNQVGEARTLLSAVISAYLQFANAAEHQQLQTKVQNQQAEYDSLHSQIEEMSKRIASLRSQRGADDPEAKLLQLEADRDVEQAGKLKAELELTKIQAAKLPRARLIQPPVAAKR